jgi:nucleoside-diphosphate-sugar epimerase
MKRVLVTEAEDALGRAVMRGLAESGYTVLGIMHSEGRRPALAKQSAEFPVELVVCDPSEASHAELLAATKAEVVVQLASDEPGRQQDHAACLREVRGTINLIHALRENLQHAVIGSCLGVYGDAAAGRVGFETPANYDSSGRLASEQFWDLETMYSGKRVTRVRLPCPLSTAEEVARAAELLVEIVQTGRVGVVDLLTMSE